MAQIREFDPHAYVINGDFDYKDDPEVWDAQIQGAFGDRYPLFASIGNHGASCGVWLRPSGEEGGGGGLG